MKTGDKTKKKTPLENLPSDTIGVVCEYLNINERNMLLGLSKTLRIEQKKFRYLNLKGWLSLKFYEDKNFRETINNLVIYPHRQISLNLAGSPIVDVSILRNVHALNLCGCRKVVDVSALRNVHTLDLRYTSIVDVSALGNVHTLNLKYTFVQDVSALGNVHTLDLGWTPVEDVSALGNVHTLDLEHCKSIVDVSALGNVHTLCLKSTNVKDMSALGNVHILLI